uniref:Uncharacterized protein n=1 Tax=Nelumbo nucifera TaxID=4432 RepID=A0A822Z1W9_NELNU|nr:TPA_asm: hypothetical protein HUJ06_007638 [Nelumbo nucifera]
MRLISTFPSTPWSLKNSSSSTSTHPSPGCKGTVPLLVTITGIISQLPLCGPCQGDVSHDPTSQLFCQGLDTNYVVHHQQTSDTSARWVSSHVLPQN